MLWTITGAVWLGAITALAYGYTRHYTTAEPPQTSTPKADRQETIRVVPMDRGVLTAEELLKRARPPEPPPPPPPPPPTKPEPPVRSRTLPPQEHLRGAGKITRAAHRAGGAYPTPHRPSSAHLHPDPATQPTQSHITLPDNKAHPAVPRRSTVSPAGPPFVENPF